MSDIIKIVQALEDSANLLTGITKTVEKETKKQKGGFLGMLLGTLGASLLGKILAGKDSVRARYGDKGQGIVRLVTVLKDPRSRIFNAASSSD